MTARRRYGEQAKPAGRPPLDERVRARIYAMHAEDPFLSVRRLAAKVTVETGLSVSRETVRLLVKSAAAAQPDTLVVRSAPSEPVDPDRPIALSVVRPMSEADHLAMDRAPGERVLVPALWVWP